MPRTKNTKMKKAKSVRKIKKLKEVSSPKGMRDIMGDEYYAFQGFFEKAQEVAVYYGFQPIETPIMEQEEIFTTAIGEGTDIVDKEMYTLRTRGRDKLALRPEHTAPLMRAYIEHGMLSQPQPVMFYQYGPSFRHDKPQRGRYRQFYQFDMDALGSDKSIMDALVIKAGISILEEAGAKNLTIEINSIGDDECRGEYVRELVSYYKKHLNELPAIDRQRLKTNPLRILDSKEEKTKTINEGAPNSLSHLCSPCKKHFKEVLEYLEEMGMEYNINKNLVRGLSYYTCTVFEIIEKDGGEDSSPLTIAAGGRYDYLARQLGSKKEVGAVGISIGVDRVIASSWYKKLSPRVIKKPKVYFIQLGTEAKLKSLNIIEILRKARIPVAKSLSRDSLSSQLSIAQKLEIPYALIFGVKEALDNTVIVRNMSNRSQKTVQLDKLLECLKSLR